MINSKKKGDIYERAIADWFNELFNIDKEDKNKFRRTPMSGGFSKNMPSDLITPPSFKFSVELKNRKSWTLDNLLEDNCEIWEYWTQCKKSAILENKLPMLIFKKNRLSSICVVLLNDVTKFLMLHDDTKRIIFTKFNESFLFFRLKDFDKTLRLREVI